MAHSSRKVSSKLSGLSGHSPSTVEEKPTKTPKKRLQAGLKKILTSVRFRNTQTRKLNVCSGREARKVSAFADSVAARAGDEDVARALAAAGHEATVAARLSGTRAFLDIIGGGSKQRKAYLLARYDEAEKAAASGRGNVDTAPDAEGEGQGPYEDKEPAVAVSFGGKPGAHGEAALDHAQRRALRHALTGAGDEGEYAPVANPLEKEAAPDTDPSSLQYTTDYPKRNVSSQVWRFGNSAAPLEQRSRDCRTSKASIGWRARRVGD